MIYCFKRRRRRTMVKKPSSIANIRKSIFLTFVFIILNVSSRSSTILMMVSHERRSHQTTITTTTTKKKTTANSDSLKRTLENSPFTRFRAVADLGFFGWRHSIKQNKVEYKSLDKITVDDVTSRIDLNLMPAKAQPIKQLKKKCPLPFQRTPTYNNNQKKQQKRQQEQQQQNIFMNKFPINPSYIVPLHIASTHRNYDLNDIDFMFGGSVLAVLAFKRIKKRTGMKYAVFMIPGTNIILVNKYHEYPINFSDPGYQFEKFVTSGKFGTNDNDKNKNKNFVFEECIHMHVLDIGGNNVLFSAECDAVDDNGDPIESKCRTIYSRLRKSTTMWQMIGNGSLSLFTGLRRKKKKKGGNDNNNNNNNNKNNYDTITNKNATSTFGNNTKGRSNRRNRRSRKNNSVQQKQQQDYGFDKNGNDIFVGEEELIKVTSEPLDKVILRGLSGSAAKAAEYEYNILEAMTIMKSDYYLERLRNGEILEIEYVNFPKPDFTLIPLVTRKTQSRGASNNNNNSNVVLPSRDVVQELLFPTANATSNSDTTTTPSSAP